jgi:transcriptional regulator with XRE-family HTH domain
VRERLEYRVADTTYAFAAGQKLKAVRRELGLTMRDVCLETSRIASERHRSAFVVSPSRLSEIENRGTTPNVCRLYSLAIVYKRDIKEILAWYGLD